MTTSMGMTESAPFGLRSSSPARTSAPVNSGASAGMEIKLSQTAASSNCATGPEHHARLLAQPEATREAFDDEGFFCSGDAVQWSDRMTCTAASALTAASRRTSLATGTFVSVGPLRGKIIAAGAPYVQDAVITGHGEHEVGAMLIPIGPAVRQLSGLQESASLAEVLSKPVAITFRG